MKNLFNILIGFAFAFSLISCEKEIDNPETGETIYIATISADSTDFGNGNADDNEATWGMLKQNLNFDFDTINFDTLDINNPAEVTIAADSIKTLLEGAKLICTIYGESITSPIVTKTAITNNMITYTVFYRADCGKASETGYIDVTYTYTLQLTPAKPKE